MTRLPIDSWNVKARPDIEPYELNTKCAVSGLEPVEDHHLWRRSFGKDFREAWWVELPDGAIVPNRVGLHAEYHRMITENKARIVMEPDGIFFYVDEHQQVRLTPQPGECGKPCPKCKGKGTVAEEKPVEAKDKEPARPKAMLGVRVPKDEKENGYEILVDLIEQAREKYAPELGWKPNVPIYYVLVAVLVEALQA